MRPGFWAGASVQETKVRPMANEPKKIRVKFIEAARKERPDGPPEIFNKGEVHELREDQAYRWINRNKAEIDVADAFSAPAPAPAPAPATSAPAKNAAPPASGVKTEAPPAAGGPKATK
mgnify:CR=1 FL=1